MHAFLFTDLESSTWLWEQHPEEMKEALATHDRILGRAVEAAGGHVLKTTGDGVIAVFPNVPDAIDACLDSQLRIFSQTWPTSRPLKVRMGLHAGEAEEREGDYFGPTLNRAARVMAAGHGGQVLLSATAASMAEGQLPEDVGLRDLGTHRLKDLTVPEHLFQLLHPGLESEFLAPVTLDSRPNNLPIQTSEFFGRKNELAEVIGLLQDSNARLVTLLGPGGTGKTRLGLQVAAELLDSYRDGVYFVDLSREREPSAAFEAVVRALDVPVASESEPLDSLKARLRDQELLIVLDNFEQVTEAAGGVVELLQFCSNLEVVVTSREALRVRAERVYNVPPMSLPDPDAPIAEIEESEAVQLFTERARASRPDFVIDEHNAHAVATITLRLDGLPLAIELAAARLNVFSPNDLLKRLSERMDILAARSRDLPERQRTLWDTIAWSYELLDEDERLVFELMAVFSTATLEAIEEVGDDASGPTHTIDNLASLVDKSLIRSDDSGGTRRFSMLQTVREYALHRLAADPEREAAVKASHARYYSELTQGLKHLLRGPRRAEILEDLSVELGNLRTAWGYWVDQGDLEQLYMLLDGLWALNDAKGWYHAALELANDMLDVLAVSEPSPDRMEDELVLRSSLARALMAIRGYSPEVEKAFQEALALADESGRASHRFPVLRSLASYYTLTANWEKAAEMAQELLELAREEEDELILVEGHFLAGAANLGNLPAALEHMDKAIELYDPKRHGAPRFRLGASPGVVARIASSIMRWQMGEVDRALPTMRDALALAREMDHPFSLAYALYHFGYAQAMRRDFEASRQCALELRDVAEENDYQIWLALSRVLEGVSMVGLGHVDEGLEKTETGIDLYRGLTAPPVFWPLILALRAHAHLAAGRHEKALALIDGAIAGVGGEEMVNPEFRVLRGDILSAASADPPQIEEAYRTAIRGARMSGLQMVELQARTRLVPLLRGIGEDDEIDQLRAVHESIRGGDDEPDVQAARELLD